MSNVAVQNSCFEMTRTCAVQMMLHLPRVGWVDRTSELLNSPDRHMINHYIIIYYLYIIYMFKPATQLAFACY